MNRLSGKGTVEGYTRLPSPHDFINSPWTSFQEQDSEHTSEMRVYVKSTRSRLTRTWLFLRPRQPAHHHREHPAPGETWRLPLGTMVTARPICRGARHTSWQ